MNNWKKDFLKELREKRTTYSDMVDFCADGLILNNTIEGKALEMGFYPETYCGRQTYYVDGDGNEITEDEYYEREDGQEVFEDVFQYFIINEQSAERFKEYTNELVIYIEELDIFLLCVTHFGTSWDYVPANWQEAE